MNLSHVRGVLSFFWFIALCALAYSQLSVPEPRNDPGNFSAYRAVNYIKEIAKAPHPGGSKAHKEVKEYVISQAQKYADTVTIFSGTGLTEYSRVAVAGHTENILAKIKGTNPSKAIMVMGHYDSQPNTPAASDDGSAVASMLEVMRLVRGAPIKNDLYFLFTDLEEVGLLGAEAFVNDFAGLEDIGVILNFEARGNSGVNYTFETSASNGWIMQQYADAIEMPRANSLGYEIYKLMPNDTDFTKFKKSEITGLNTAFLDGYVNYHSATDTWQNIDLGSLQNQGQNMWQLVTHLGSKDLNVTKGDDVIYFNIFNWAVIYSPIWDWIFIGLSIFLLVLLLARSRTGLSKILKGLLWYGLIIVMAMLLTLLFTQVVLSLNPHYDNFYSYNFYNAGIYLWMYLGTALTAILLINRLFKSGENLTMSALAIHLILAILLKLFLPTGSFILYIPMLCALVILLASDLMNKNWLKHFILPIIPTILWTPLIVFLYTVFSLSLSYASVIFIVLLLAYLQPALADWSRSYPKLPWVAAMIMLLTGFVGGQLTSSYNPEQPLRVKLAYGLNTDTKEAIWFSPDNYEDEFSSNYLSETGTIPEIFPKSQLPYRKGKAPAIGVKRAGITILNDSTYVAGRHVTLRITPEPGVIKWETSFANEAFIRRVNNRPLAGDLSGLYYYAPRSNGDTLYIETSSSSEIELHLIQYKQGIKESLLTHPMPDNIVFGTGSMSNVMLVAQTVKL